MTWDINHLYTWAQSHTVRLSSQQSKSRRIASFFVLDKSKASNLCGSRRVQPKDPTRYQDLAEEHCRAVSWHSLALKWNHWTPHFLNVHCSRIDAHPFMQFYQKHLRQRFILMLFVRNEKRRGSNTSKSAVFPLPNDTFLTFPCCVWAAQWQTTFTPFEQHSRTVESCPPMVPWSPSVNCLSWYGPLPFRKYGQDLGKKKKGAAGVVYASHCTMYIIYYYITYIISPPFSWGVSKGGVQNM